eukprot:1148015-Pelagomonas_calceolata.AAC.5
MDHGEDRKSSIHMRLMTTILPRKDRLERQAVTLTWPKHRSVPIATPLGARIHDHNWRRLPLATVGAHAANGATNTNVDDAGNKMSKKTPTLGATQPEGKARCLLSAPPKHD